MKKISVVMTTYNGEKYVSEQLESICSQTKKPDEILIFDDTSSDDTVHIVKKTIEKNPNLEIKITVNEKNVGWQRNFYNGIKKSTGDYIFLADQDDIWKENKIEKMISVMVSNPDISLLASNYSIINDRSGTVNEYKYSKDFINDSSLKKVKFTSKFFLVSRPGCTYCFKKELFLLAEKNWIDFLPHDQLISVYGMLTDSFYIYNENLISFRRHDNNASGMGTKNIDINKRIASCKTQYEFITNVLSDDELNLSKEEKKQLILYAEYQKKRSELFYHPSFFKWAYIFIKYYHFHFSIKSAIKDFIVAFRK